MPERRPRRDPRQKATQAALTTLADALPATNPGPGRYFEEIATDARSGLRSQRQGVAEFVASIDAQETLDKSTHK